jgi:hypothetical protein
MAVIFGLLGRGLQSGEECGIADAMNLTRLNCRHAYSYQRVTVAFAYDKSRASERKLLLVTNADSDLVGTAILASYFRVLKRGLIGGQLASWQSPNRKVSSFP